MKPTIKHIEVTTTDLILPEIQKTHGRIPSGGQKYRKRRNHQLFLNGSRENSQE